MIFKKKKNKTADLVPDGVALNTPVVEAPKLKPACGFEYSGMIYKTAAEANLAYQRDMIDKLLEAKPYTLHMGDYNAWLGPLKRRWEEVVKIAHMKLEVE